MIEKILLFIKGFIMGIANIIPGVSGGTLALILGIYERFIDSISHFFKDIKKNLLFLVPIGLGMIASIATMSNIIDFSYKNYPIPTTLFFVGLVLGGIPLLSKKAKVKKNINLLNIIVLILTFSLVIFMTFADKIFSTTGEVSLINLNLLGYIALFIVGIIAAATMVIPGVSGSLVLMLLGYYYPIVSLIKELVHFNNLISNLIVAAVFGFGVLLGIVLVSKLIEYLFKKHEKTTYFGVLGFIYASIFAIPISSFSGKNIAFDGIQIIIGLFLLSIGGFISYRLGDK